MSNIVITLLVVFAFAAGLGLGLIVKAPRRKTPNQLEAERVEREARAHLKTESAVYFGRDDNDPDHPHDIERAASHRYDGMADGDVPYVPSGLDFSREPR